MRCWLRASESPKQKLWSKKEGRNGETSRITEREYLLAENSGPVLCPPCRGPRDWQRTGHTGLGGTGQDYGTRSKYSDFKPKSYLHNRWVTTGFWFEKLLYGLVCKRCQSCFANCCSLNYCRCMFETGRGMEVDGCAIGHSHVPVRHASSRIRPYETIWVRALLLLSIAVSILRLFNHVWGRGVVCRSVKGEILLIRVVCCYSFPTIEISALWIWFWTQHAVLPFLHCVL